MLPLIILGGGVVVSAAAFFGIKKSCTKCESIFTLNETCLVCGKDVCGDCGKDTDRIDYKNWPISPRGRVCVEHEQTLLRRVEELQSAIDRSEGVSLYSRNFKGVTPNPKLNSIIESQFHTDRDVAERELKILAAMKDAQVVIAVEFLREKRQDGNYKYSVWKATGTV